jgi:hypothetical protein
VRPELFSDEKQVTPSTPPAFLAHAKDDRGVVPDNSKGEMRDAWQTQSVAWLSALKFIPAVAGKEKAPLIEERRDTGADAGLAWQRSIC